MARLDITKKSITTYGVCSLMILAFFLLRLSDFTINAFVPDEIWHVQYMHDIQNSPYFNVENYQGHGSAFWYFGAVIEKYFGDFHAFFILRITSLIALTATAFYMVKVFRAAFPETVYQGTTLLFTAFILTTPLFWWGGKLIFPEFFQCFLIAFAYYLIYTKQRFSLLAFFALGFCFGLKLHAGPVLAFFVADRFFSTLESKRFMNFSACILALILGFLFCNPYVFKSLPTFLANIQGNGHYHGCTVRCFLHHWNLMLFGRYSEWDLVYFGGVNRMTLPLANLALLAILIGYACIKKTLRTASLLIFILSIVIALSINYRFLSYYVFTMIILFILLSTRAKNFPAFSLSILLGIGVIINMMITVPNVYVNRTLSSYLASNVEHGKTHTLCIAEAVRHEKNIGAVINNSDMGSNANREPFFWDGLFLEKTKANRLTLEIPIITISGKGIFVKLSPPQLLSFINGNTELIYLDGRRTRLIGRYKNFVPDFAAGLAKVSHNTVDLNMRYLNTCEGSRVSVLTATKRPLQQ